VSAAANALVVLAAVGAPHGVRGEVRVKTFLADPADLGAYGPLTTPSGRRLTVTAIRPLKADLVVARFAEVSDRDGAEALTGETLAVPRTALPEDADAETFYHADLIGLTAEDDVGARLGTVVALHDFGAGDILEIRGAAGTRLLPFTKAVVPVIDVAGGRIVVVLPAETEAREP